MIFLFFLPPAYFLEGLCVCIVRCFDVFFQYMFFFRRSGRRNSKPNPTRFTRQIETVVPHVLVGVSQQTRGNTSASHITSSAHLSNSTHLPGHHCIVLWMISHHLSVVNSYSSKYIPRFFIFVSHEYGVQ